MNQVAQPFGGMGAGDRVGDASVVAPPRMPTEKETLDRGVLGPANERDSIFQCVTSVHGPSRLWCNTELQGIGVRHRSM